MTILVTGGAGYIGSVLVGLLLAKNYKVKVLDNLSLGGESIINFLNNENFEFIKGDIREEKDLKKAMQGVDYIAHLAAIVGDPACAKNPELTNDINLKGAKLAYKTANKMGVKKFIFASTCSNYGKMADLNKYADEHSELKPVSLYAKTKVEFEQFLLSQDKSNATKPTCLRFATVYGLSPRMRFDLTVNEFTKELALNKELIVFGEQFWRPYCHVNDLSRALICAFEAEQQNIAFNVYNVGDTSENYQKQMIVEEIKKYLPNSKIKFVKKDEDPRDYKVSFAKIKNELDFKITKKVPDGIKDIINAVRNNIISNPDNPQYKNI